MDWKVSGRIPLNCEPYGGSWVLFVVIIRDWVFEYILKLLSDKGPLGLISILLYVIKARKGEVSSQGHSDTLHHTSLLYCIILWSNHPRIGWIDDKNKHSSRSHGKSYWVLPKLGISWARVFHGLSQSVLEVQVLVWSTSFSRWENWWLKVWNNLPNINR